MNSLIIQTRQHETVAVLTVHELEPGRCKGCCFDLHGGAYSYPEHGCNAAKNTFCSRDATIYIPDTDEGRAAYVAAKMVGV